MIFTSEKTKGIFALDYDKYGDSYTEDVNSEDLRRIFNNISSEVFISNCWQMVCSRFPNQLNIYPKFGAKISFLPLVQLNDPFLPKVGVKIGVSFKNRLHIFNSLPSFINSKVNCHPTTDEMFLIVFFSNRTSLIALGWLDKSLDRFSRYPVIGLHAGKRFSLTKMCHILREMILICFRIFQLE